MSRTSRKQSLKAPEFHAREARRRTAPGLPVDTTDGPLPTEQMVWRIVIADSSEARFYEADTPVRNLVLRMTIHNPAARVLDQELVSDRGGSKLNRVRGGYQTLTPGSSAHRESGERFAKEISTQAGRRFGRDERLVLVAAARLMAQIEKALSAAVRGRIACRIPRDVMHEPGTRLRERLRMALKSPGG